MREQGSLAEVAIEVVNWNPAGVGVAPVDVAHHSIDLFLEVSVGFDVGATWHHHLDQRVPRAGDLFASEQALESGETFRNPLGVVEAVDTEDQLAVPHRLTDSLDLLPDIRVDRERL